MRAVKRNLGSGMSSCLIAGGERKLRKGRKESYGSNSGARQKHREKRKYRGRKSMCQVEKESPRGSDDWGKKKKTGREGKGAIGMKNV